MRVWTVSELDNVIASLKPLLGARLQEVQTAESDVVLGFYTPRGMLWLWIDLNALRPCLLPWAELPLHLPPKKSPLNLFLKAHFADRVLRSVERDRQHGRVVILNFGRPGDEVRLELRLFPHGRNILAFTKDKQIAWQKPKELSEHHDEVGEEMKTTNRSLDELREQWRALRSGKGPGKTGKDVRQRLTSDLDKKKKAVEKVRQDLQRKVDQPWKEVGDWLKTHQSLAVPKEWEPFIDKRRKLSWNIEQCFSKAREIEGKVFGTEQRLKLLQAEISKLEARMDQPLTTKALEKPAPQPFVGADAQGRTLRISDEITVVAGKSAADNLKLLRRARAWDLWFHLKDEPASHAILFRNNSTSISDSVVQQVVEWYVRQFLGNKFKAHAGEKFLILMAECRHVRPIKGDKLGRVTVHNERVVGFKVPS